MTRASIRKLFGFYEAGEPVKFDELLNVTRVQAAFVARPTVAKGLEIFKRG